MKSLSRLAREIATLCQAGYPLIYLSTAEESRALRLVSQAAKLAKRPVQSWALQRGLSQDPGAKGPTEALLQLKAETAPQFFVMLDLHRHLDQPAVVRALKDAVLAASERGQSYLLIAPELRIPPELEQDCRVIDLPLPDPEELSLALRQVAAQLGVTLSPDLEGAAVRAALGLSFNEAVRAFRRVLLLRGSLAPGDLKLIIDEKKQALRRSEVLEFHELQEGLDAIGGLGALKKWLGTRSLAFGEDARRFGLPAPKGLLLLGVQGCGKSLSAKAVAELWKLPLLRLDVAALFSGGSKSPEAKLREAMRAAESLAPVVLWVDEIEKGFVQVEGDAEGSRVFGAFITWLAEKQAQVFVVATANAVDQLPPELLRKGRFDEIFFVDLPSAGEREEILAIHLQKRQRAPSQYPELTALAKRAEYFSGAELEQVVVAALYRAFSAGRELIAQDLESAIVSTVPLYRTYEEDIKQLRDWARKRARPATEDQSLLVLFGV